MVKADNKITELVEQESIIDDEYKQRIARFLEHEGDGVRKEAEKECTNIICKAREEYVRRLSRFLEEEEEKIRKQAERDAENIVTKALAEKEHILSEAGIMAKSRAEEVMKKVKIQAEQTVLMQANIAKQRSEKVAEKYRDECKKRAEQEAATIINNANEQAIQVIAWAKERANKQADEEKHEKVKRIMESARLESANIIAKAKQAASKEAEETANRIISVAQQKAIQIINKTIEKLNNGEEEELANLMSEVKHKSERETTNTLGELELEAEQLIKKVINDTNGQGEAANGDNKIEDMEEIEFAVETREEVKELRKSEAMSDSEQWEEIMTISQEQKAKETLEVEEETATVTSEEEMRQPEDESILSTFQASKAKQDKQSEAVLAESSETLIEEHDIEIEKTGLDIVGHGDESLYTGEVEVRIELLGAVNILAKLSSYLANTSEIKLIHTFGCSEEGNAIVYIYIVLDNPLPLVEMISLQIPEAQVTGEPLNENGKKQKTRRINIARKEGDIIPAEDSQV